MLFAGAPLKRRIVIDGKTYEVEYDGVNEKSSPPVSSNLAQSIVLPTPQASGEEASDVDESKLCRSPVAGIVTRINVEHGRSVKAGDVLVVVEAMKMENNLTATAAAVVQSISVKVGDTVKPRQIVVTLS
jgi:methylmalonyl-CoA carboxyltransferase small subunit